MGARAIVRVIGWSVAVVAAVPVALYAFALAVNWRDEAPSPEAQQLATAAAPAPIPDSANAYVYVLGLGAPRDRDVAAVGAARAEWIRKLAADPQLDRASDPYPGSAPETRQVSAPLAEVLTPCGTPDARCAAALEAAAGTLRARLDEQRPFIDRYRVLVGYHAWREVTTGDLRGPLASYLEPRYARQLFLLDTWLQATQGNAEQVRAALDADLALWRMALTESDSLFGKAMAARFVSDHFDWGNLILRRLPPERQADGVPPTWRVSLTNDERSMRRALTGEWRFAAAAVRSMKAYGLMFPLPQGTKDPRSTADRLNGLLTLPLLQPQASANRDAAALLGIDALLNRPYLELNAALARAPELDARASGVIATTYNVIGRLLMTPDRATTLADYGARVADLEGVRRAALLAADLRALRIPASLAAAMVPIAAVRDPYTGGPFGWAPDPGAITFTGLEHGERARHSFLY
jgi:hypothetical protein